jgi:8-amino-7-oxononanoate synthase
MSPPHWQELFERDHEALCARRLDRRLRTLRPIDAIHVELEGRVVTNFCSNNYLGLTHHPLIIEAAAQAAQMAGAGSGAAALIAGHSDLHASTEAAIATWKGTEAAVLLPSGYQANHAAVQTIAAVVKESARPARVLMDKLCHASLIDAVRGSGLPLRVFPHNDLRKLQRLLSDAPVDEPQVVITESIFSMDGDASDLRGIATLKTRFPFLLLVDEAHGGGVYGPAGAGLTAELGLSDHVDVTVATFSKAAGVAGGAVCAARWFVNAMLSRGRAFVYSTSVPPAVAAGIKTSLDVMRTEPQRQTRVRELALRVRRRLREVGRAVVDGDSPIIPIIVGDEQAALDAADRLLEQGILVIAVRPPTVPRGGSRLRITLSSSHTDEEIDRLLWAIAP